MTEVVSQGAPSMKPFTKGGERNRCATCYWAGPFMHDQILNNPPKLNKVTEIRDGSIPMFAAEYGQADSHSIPASQAVFHGHIDEPRVDATHLADSFLFSYLNASKCDARIKVVLKSLQDGQETVLLERNLDGNIAKQYIQRDAFTAGRYELIVKLVNGSEEINDASVMVHIV